MRTRSLFVAMAAVLALAACAPLTAEAPLFSPADQIGPPPLMEGVWIQVSKDCPARNARRRGRLPTACSPAELRRRPDGAWLFKLQDHVAQQLRENQAAGEPPQADALQLIIAPATERRTPDAFAPLYLAEYRPVDEAAEPTAPHYVIIAPIGQLPAREVFAYEVSCSDALREGPIEGITESRNERGELSGCVAANQSAVRIAVRRAAIENLSTMLQSPEGARFLFVRP